MATTTFGIPAAFGVTQTTETDAGATAIAVKASSGTLYTVEIDNSQNTINSYVKIYDVASGGTTVGTTDPDVILKVHASVKVTYHFTQGIAFGTAITLACLNSSGTAGTNSPASDVAVKLVYD
mgnify:CR=1 FL=1